MAIDEVKKGNGNGSKQLVEWFRIITPVLVMVSIAILGGISFQLRALDGKVFTHLTNHEIHVPREQMVLSGEFTMQSKFSNEKYDRLVEQLCLFREEIKTDMREAIALMRTYK